MARQRNLVKKANVSLADLTSLVLHRYLPKDTSIRVSTEWDNPTLSSAQEQYAALDVYAELSIFELFSSTAVSGPVTEETLGGTQVKLLSRDHSSTVAFGVLAPDRPAKFNGVNVSKTRAVVNIAAIAVPAYLVRAELLEPHVERPLSSFGPLLPFGLLCSLKDLQICVGEEYRAAQATPYHAPLPNQPHISSQESYTMSGESTADIEASADVDIGEDDWRDGVDLDPDNEQSVKDAKADPLGATYAQALAKLPRLPVPDSPVRSRVNGDIYHLMAMFKIDIHHGIRRPFSRALRDALFIPDPEDKLLVSKALEQRMTSYEQMVLSKSDWVWKRVKRYIPPPEMLLPRITNVLQTYGPLTDAKTRQPLFNEKSWEKVTNIIENVRMGFYSDPPGVTLYANQGTDSSNIPLYRCFRGTNNVEGGVHQNIAKRFGSYNASPRFACNLLRDFVLSHNLRVRLHPITFFIIFTSDMFSIRWEH